MWKWPSTIHTSHQIQLRDQVLFSLWLVCPKHHHLSPLQWLVLTKKSSGLCIAYGEHIYHLPYKSLIKYEAYKELSYYTDTRVKQDFIYLGKKGRKKLIRKHVGPIQECQLEGEWGQDIIGGVYHLISLEKNCPLMKEANIVKLEEAYIANLLSIGNFEYFTEEEYIFFRSSYKRELTIYKLPNKSVF